jgi:hypothetical protein
MSDPTVDHPYGIFVEAHDETNDGPPVAGASVTLLQQTFPVDAHGRVFVNRPNILVRAPGYGDYDSRPDGYYIGVPDVPIKIALHREQTPPPPPVVPPILPPPVGQADAIDLRSVIFVDPQGPHDVASWPPTARITALNLGPQDGDLDHDHEDGPAAWPDVVIPGWINPDGTPGTIQYTTWMILVRDGLAFTAGGIESWKGRIGGFGPVNNYAANWYYFDARLNSQPEPGELVGFFVTAGDARRKDVRRALPGGGLLTARSAVVAIRYPGSQGGVYTF